jgi:hypothetical protein
VRRALAIAGALVVVAACTPPSARGLDKDALDSNIGAAIGDPNTCVLLADRASGKIVYQFGEPKTCDRALPACDGPGTMTAAGALAFAMRPNGRLISCPSVPDGSRTVGWAAAHIPGTKHDLIYSAVMESDHALPGQEISARLADAFSDSGL